MLKKKEENSSGFERSLWSLRGKNESKRFDRSTWTRVSDDKRYVSFAGYERDPVVDYVTRRICIPICLFVSCLPGSEEDVLLKGPLTSRYPHRFPRTSQFDRRIYNL